MEEQKQATEQATEQKQEEKPLNIVEQARIENEKLTSTLEELKKERVELEVLKANEVLSGTAGGHIEPKPKEETDKEYSERIDREIREGKYNG